MGKNTQNQQQNQNNEETKDANAILNKLNFKEGEHLSELFLDDAKSVADKIKTEMSSTQFRKFYDKVSELNDKARGIKNDEDEFKKKILPFVKMLYSKAVYSKNRGKAGDTFVKLMKNGVTNVNSKEELQNFKYFLEAIIGFMPKNKEKK